MNTGTTSLKDEEERYEMQRAIVSSIFGITKEFKSKLRVSEEGRRHAVASTHLYVTDCLILDAVQIAERLLWASLRLNELPDSDSMKEDSSPLSFLQSYRDEVQQWNRKLIEVITILALFDGTGTFNDNYVRHFYLLIELESLRKQQNDFKDYYGIELSNNTTVSISQVVGHMNVLEQSLDPSKAWYLDKGREPTKFKHRASSMSSRMLQASLFFSDDEILVSGMSYLNAFGRPSKNIHADFGSTYDILSYDDLNGMQHKLHIGVLCILIRCAKLTGLTINTLTAYNTSLEKLKTGDKLDTLRTIKYLKGDFVIVVGELCEIIETKQADPFGWVSYKVRFISNPLLPAIAEDWFPALYLGKCIANRERLIKSLRVKFQTEFPALVADEYFEQTLDNAITESAIAIFKEWVAKQSSSPGVVVAAMQNNDKDETMSSDNQEQ